MGKNGVYISCATVAASSPMQRLRWWRSQSWHIWNTGSGEAITEAKGVFNEDMKGVGHLNTEFAL